MSNQRTFSTSELSPETFAFLNQFSKTFASLEQEAFDYAKKLQNAGVKVELHNYKDVIHGFLDFPLAESVKQQAMQDIIRWINIIR